MVDATSKEYTSEELEFLDQMSRLLEHPGFQMLTERVKEKREQYRLNLATGIGMTGDWNAPPVDQREIDYKRGFWNGAVFALVRFPKQFAKDWEKFVAEQTTKESDPA